MLKGKGVYLASSNKMQKYRGESHTEGEVLRLEGDQCVVKRSDGVMVGK
jgi:hypothetical protein